jgi:hypothetical protein
MRFPAHEVTSRHLGSAYPFMVDPGLTDRGVLVGRDLVGGSFYFDPFLLYAQGALTNPNVVVFGQIGRGKSAFVKTYLWRQLVFGRRAWVIDPKGEYGELATAMGVEQLFLRPGGNLRLNPLDAPPTVANEAVERHEEVARRRGELLCSLASASLGRPLVPAERAAVEVSVSERRGSTRAGSKVSGGSPTADPLTLPMVVEALMHPTEAAARTLGTDVGRLSEDGRNVALELRRLVSGDLRGMFDGLTSDGIRLDAPLVVLDLSAVYHSAALGVLMTCAAAWLQSALSSGPTTFGGGVILVVDEAWAILSNLGVARWLQSTWKLSRAWGVANFAVLHRISDLDATGSIGSEQQGLAQGLLSDSETRVVYGQPPGEVGRAVGMLGLSETEARVVAGLKRGVALWKVGSRSFLVQHRLSPLERAIVDTDARMKPDVTGSVRDAGIRGHGHG